MYIYLTAACKSSYYKRLLLASSLLGPTALRPAGLTYVEVIFMRHILLIEQMNL